MCCERSTAERSGGFASRRPWRRGDGAGNARGVFSVSTHATVARLAGWFDLCYTLDRSAIGALLASCLSTVSATLRMWAGCCGHWMRAMSYLFASRGLRMYCVAELAEGSPGQSHQQEDSSATVCRKHGLTVHLVFVITGGFETREGGWSRQAVALIDILDSFVAAHPHWLRFAPPPPAPPPRQSLPNRRVHTRVRYSEGSM